MSAEYFSYYSVEFAIRFEAITGAFMNQVFGFRHIPTIHNHKYNQCKIGGKRNKGTLLSDSGEHFED